MKSLEGHLLIASPNIGDPRFERTVVFLLHHDERGAFGVIVNRQLPETIQGLWQKLGETQCHVDRNLNLGGPVSGPIIALHSLEDAGELEIAPGLYVAEHKEQLNKLMQIPECPIRVFVGHAGWTSGQLEEEIEQGVWSTLEATPEFIFSDDQDLWVNAMRAAGRQFYRAVLGITGFPHNAMFN